MPDYTYRSWVPRGVPAKFKNIQSVQFDVGTTGEQLWQIDQPNDKEWPPDDQNPPSVNNTRLLPAANVQFKIYGNVSVSAGTSASAAAWYLLSIGTGDWQLIRDPDRESSRFPSEELRLIFYVKISFMHYDPDYLGGFFGFGSEESIAFVDKVWIPDIWICKYDTDPTLAYKKENNIFPYGIKHGFDFSNNRILGHIVGGDGNSYGDTVDNYDAFVIPPQSIRIEFSFPGIYQNQGYNVEYLTTNPDGSESYGPMQRGVHFPVTNTSSKVSTTFIKSLVQTTWLRNSGVSMRSIPSVSTIVAYNYTRYDKLLGYHMSVFQDKENNIILGLSKDGKTWRDKILIANDDSAAGRCASLLYYTDGSAKLIYEKADGAFSSPKNEDPKKYIGPPKPIGGEGVKGSGIWQVFIKNISPLKDGCITFESVDEGKTIRKESAILNGKNPVVFVDDDTGVEYLFYWAPKRQPISSTGQKATIIEKGGIFYTFSKDGKKWNMSQDVLSGIIEYDYSMQVIPDKSDDFTNIPAQTVGVTKTGAGSVLISWTSEDGNNNRVTMELSIKPDKPIKNT